MMHTQQHETQGLYLSKVTGLFIALDFSPRPSKSLSHKSFLAIWCSIPELAAFQESSLPSEKSKQLHRYHYTKEIS